MSFNEINNIVKIPWFAGALRTEEDENPAQAQYQAAHHMFVAHSLANKSLKKINPKAKMGCMLSLGVYPDTPNRKIYLVVMSFVENLCFSDVMIRGAYPAYSKRLFEELSIDLE